MPDVAFDADPNTGVNVYFDDSTFGKTAGWLTVGGTSLSVQCWAAIMALVDQGSPLTNASQALYKLAGAQSNFNPYGAYRDITSGSNGAHSAGPGYDLVTGLGSPVANALVPAVLTTPTIAPESGVYILPAVTVSISASLSVGQSVYYTTNGNQPTASSHMYSAPFTLPLSTGTTTVCAAVYSARSGLFGVVSEADYTGIASLAAPTIYPNSGSINSTQQITITDPNNFTGDSLYYTLDGTKPGLQSNLYTAPFTLSNSATVTAAVLNPTAGWSQSTSAVFTVAATSTAGGGGGGGSTAGGGGGGGGGGGAMAAAAPTVQTDSAQSITASSAILNGNIVSGGGANITEYGFLWGTSQDNLANTLQVGTDNHSGDFTATLSNLTGGTAYYFQAFAKNTSEADGTVMSFTTTGEPQTTTTSTISNTTTTTAPAFSDVQASYWAYDAISNLSRLDYITGYPDGSFKPDGTITRAEFVSILTRALKLQAYSPPVPGFTDVSSSDWFYSSVESSVHAGIASGNGSGSFSPNEPVTREEMATILVNALSKQDEAKASMSARTLFADDTSISSWARGFVVMAVNEGLIRGYPDNTFRPQGDATRAEACSMISSFLSIQK
jgi:hypothetical protein